MNHGEIKSYGTVPQEQHDQSSHTEEEFLLPAVNPAEHSFNCAQKISQCVGQQSAFGWTRPQALILVFLCGSVLLVSILVPFSSSGNATMSSSPPQPPSVPWPHVNRSSSAGNGVTSFLNLDLFHRSLLLESSTDDTTTERKFRFPFPTGAFWTNLVLTTTADRGLSYPIAVYPYAYKWSHTLLQVSYPFRHRVEDATSIHDYFFPDLTVSLTQNITSRYIRRFDQLSVTLRYEAGESSFYEAYLVQGSPYITILCEAVSPKVAVLSTYEKVWCPESEMGSSSASEQCVAEEQEKFTVLTGTRFVFRTTEGMTWAVFTSESITMKYNHATRTSLTTEGLFSGMLRFAHVPENSFPAKIQHSPSSGALQKLGDHSTAYPVGGRVSWSFRQPKQGRNFGTVRFDFEQMNTGNKAGELFMLALPHHIEAIKSSAMPSASDFELPYQCIKGPMSPMIGESWTYDEELPEVGFEEDIFLPKLQHKEIILEVLVTAVEEDSDLALPSLDENIYGYGKQIGRLAHLLSITVAIRNRYNDGHGGQAGSLIERLSVVETKVARRLFESLTSFLQGKSRDSLVYDELLGGLISHDGILDSEADFGNGRYNDHHFHYGYLLSACAVMGKYNETFAESYKHRIDAIFFDIASSYNFDSSSSSAKSYSFPGTRHFSWYDGHSYASGLFPFGNGKSQESSSEAVNGYLGAFLWSSVKDSLASSSGSLDFEFSRLLLAMEIRGAQTYWHMKQRRNTVSPYTKAFAANIMVGNVGMMDAICSTWFGTNPLYVHLINFLPISSATRVLFQRDFAKDEYEHLVASHREVEMSWKGYLVALHAISDPNAAWSEALELQSSQLDTGTSKSAILFWALTQGHWTESSHVPHANTTLNTSSDCAQHNRCKGLSGQCCPSSAGVFLSCCT